MKHKQCSLDDDSPECSGNTQPKSNTMPSTELNIGNLIHYSINKLI